MSGRLSGVQRHSEPVTGWIADRQGVVRFGYGYRDKKGLYIARSGESGEWRTLARFERFDNEAFRPLGFGSLGDSLLIRSTHNGRDAIFEMDLQDQADRQLLFSRPDVDVSGTMRWPSDGRIVGFRYEREKPHKHIFAERAEQVQRLLDKSLPDTINSIVGSSRDEQRVLVYASSDVKAGHYYLLDTAKASLVRLGASNSALENVKLAPHQPVIIKARDGTALPGYLTVPVGTSAKNLPTVIYPHGGPQLRDSWGYNPVVQFMASRGYAAWCR
jgi:dipeptidyl aminopeptidase/acylaminoacyl peptidase